MRNHQYTAVLSQPPCRPSGCRNWQASSNRRACFTILVALCSIAAIAYLTWLSLVASLINRFSPPPLQSNGVRRLLSTWKTPADSVPSTYWLEGFSIGIEPVSCHSHNDYWQPVPLFAALSAGCTSVEADVWLDNGSQNTTPRVLVGHDKKALSADRTLSSLYITPLRAILDYQNNVNGSNETGWHGVFETAPQTTLVLLLDFKIGGQTAWTAVSRELQPLRDANWLTYWDKDAARRIWRPVTVVATGDVEFDMIKKQEVKYIFYDAPLTDLSGGEYTVAESLYASAEMKKAIGTIQWRMSSKQLHILQGQIKEAKNKNLISRYWGTPSWPISVRNGVWEDLVRSGVGVLNVDDLSTATRWDWRFCSILGLTICR
ncbi:hypothetical protein B0J12DRAFT_714682 [Macrophomina phaseolina]|uniref:Altered inheritance of mitochondria protein 6 n=1 Tax=Macrophomina phaseolina TaxID=35725 RepID=A0ABQ8FSH3_9PEZI|nr:hypothetical protein B0J12DRAFT_714682 [Macrophomina phaseolina]